MSAIYIQSLAVQAPARIRALWLSYGIAASPSQARRAAALAPSARAIRPGIYGVGACQVNLWRRSCNCKDHRTRALAGKPFAPCAHFLALYLAGEWSPISNPVMYLASVGIEEPEPIATYCHVAGRRGCYRITGAYRQLPACPPWVEICSLTGEPQPSARMSEINHLVTIYD